MPWEVTIKRPDGGPLGTVAEVRQRVSDTVPDFAFYREASGLEKIAAAREQGIEFPDVLRQHFEQLTASE